MNSVDTQYLELLKKIKAEGNFQLDRTGTGTYSIFAHKMEFDLFKGFPLLTTKEVWYKGILHELLWFIKGDTNIQYLVKNNVNIWTAWAYKRYINFVNHILKIANGVIPESLGSSTCYYDNYLSILKDARFSDIAEAAKDYPFYTQAEFAKKIVSDDEFAVVFGNLGPVYGSQWIDWNGKKINQLDKVIEDLKINPDSRRHIVSAWNVEKIPYMALDPCHYIFQFHSYLDKDNRRRLSMYWVQRSVDTFLGLPFNIASYATLLLIVAKMTDHIPDKLSAFLGNTHLYVNHMDAVNEQLTREPYELPTLEILKKHNKISDYQYQDFKLNGYKSHPKIKADIAV